MGQLIDELKNQNILSANPQSVLYDYCQINHHDQGWFADSYYQDCKLNYVFVSETKLTTSAIISQIDANSPIMQELKINIASSTAPNADSSCGIGSSSYTRLKYYGSFGGIDIRNSLSSERNTNYGKYYCRLPRQPKLGIDISFISQARVVTKLKGDFPDKFSTDKNYLVIEASIPYYYENLGCSFPKIMICNNPRIIPVSAN